MPDLRLIRAEILKLPRAAPASRRGRRAGLRESPCYSRRSLSCTRSTRPVTPPPAARHTSTTRWASSRMAAPGRGRDRRRHRRRRRHRGRRVPRPRRHRAARAPRCSSRACPARGRSSSARARRGGRVRAARSRSPPAGGALSRTTRRRRRVRARAARCCSPPRRVGLAALTGARGMVIGVVLAFQLGVSPLLAQLGALGNARHAIPSVAIARLDGAEGSPPSSRSATAIPSCSRGPPPRWAAACGARGRRRSDGGRPKGRHVPWARAGRRCLRRRPLAALAAVLVAGVAVPVDAVRARRARPALRDRAVHRLVAGVAAAGAAVAAGW